MLTFYKLIHMFWELLGKSKFYFMKKNVLFIKVLIIFITSFNYNNIFIYMLLNIIITLYLKLYLSICNIMQILIYQYPENHNKILYLN